MIFDVHALRDEKDGGCRRNFNSRVLNNAYQNPSSRVPSLSNGELVVSSNLLSLSLSFFLLFYLRPTVRLPPLSSSLSAVFITHRRHGARLHYTHIHSTVASLEKSGVRSLSSVDVASSYPSRIFQCVLRSGAFPLLTSFTEFFAFSLSFFFCYITRLMRYF